MPIQSDQLTSWALGTTQQLTNFNCILRDEIPIAAIMVPRYLWQTFSAAATRDVSCRTYMPRGT